MKFGVREICDVTFKAVTDNQKVGNTYFKKYQPVFTIDTATTSEMSQESTTVYAQGGKGYNRLIAWEGEKTMTFTVTDALLSPMGLAVLTGAGLINAGEGADEEHVHVHLAMDASVDASGKAKISAQEIADEIGIALVDGTVALYVCKDEATPVYGTVIDGSGYGYKWIQEIAIDNAVDGDTDLVKLVKGENLEFTVTGVTNETVRFDFYAVMKKGAQEITIAPEDFGGFFYVEADTLFRREDDGQDMAATLTFPRVKIQSGFTFTMAATGDPSTFDFVMDAFPGYTRFNHTKKVNVTMSIVGADKLDAEASVEHTPIPEFHAKKN